MATNQVFKYVDSLSLPVPEGTESGDAVVLDAATGWVGVAQTNRQEEDTPWKVGSYTEDYAGGNGPGYASVALKGAFALEVTGQLAPKQAVYAVVNGSGVVTSLTATAGSNVRFGRSLTTKGSGAGIATVLIDGAPAAA